MPRLPAARCSVTFIYPVAALKCRPAEKETVLRWVISQLFSSFIFLKAGPVGQPLLVYDMSVNCTSLYMQVDFTLKSPYLDTETFRFDNRSCGSHAATSEHVSLRTPLNACGTTSRDSGDSVTYVNKVVAETKDKRTIYIVEFPFSCTYRSRETIGVPSFQPRKKVTFFEGITLVLVRCIYVESDVLGCVAFGQSSFRLTHPDCLDFHVRRNKNLKI